jgi:hypothetical protein
VADDLTIRFLEEDDDSGAASQGPQTAVAAPGAFSPPQKSKAPRTAREEIEQTATALAHRDAAAAGGYAEPFGVMSDYAETRGMTPQELVYESLQQNFAFTHGSTQDKIDIARRTLGSCSREEAAAIIRALAPDFGVLQAPKPAPAKSKAAADGPSVGSVLRAAYRRHS